jgi:hypothetical protein
METRAGPLGFYPKKKESSILKLRTSHNAYFTILLLMLQIVISYDAGINAFDTANVSHPHNGTTHSELIPFARCILAVFPKLS